MTVWLSLQVQVSPTLSLPSSDAASTTKVMFVMKGGGHANTGQGLVALVFDSDGVTDHLTCLISSAAGHAGFLDDIECRVLIHQDVLHKSAPLPDWARQRA